jgi:hypothetical protein
LLQSWRSISNWIGGLDVSIQIAQHTAPVAAANAILIDFDLFRFQILLGIPAAPLHAFDQSLSNRRIDWSRSWPFS